MRPEENKAILIGAGCLLLPAIAGTGLGFGLGVESDSPLMPWVAGAVFIIGVFAGSIPLFFMKLAVWRKVLLIVGYLVVSFGLVTYSFLIVACSVYDQCL